MEDWNIYLIEENLIARIEKLECILEAVMLRTIGNRLKDVVLKDAASLYSKTESARKERQRAANQYKPNDLQINQEALEKLAQALRRK